MSKQTVLKVLGTGSKGNCYVLNRNGRSVILDAGIRYQDILKGVAFDLEKVDGCFVTHAHLDHAKSASDLIANGVTVAMSQGTADMMFDPDDYLMEQVYIAKHNTLIGCGGWAIKPFNVNHDAPGTLGFLVNRSETDGSKLKILYMTDADTMPYKFNGLTHLVIECNYVTDILMSNLRSASINDKLRNRIKHTHMALETLVGWLKTLDLTECRKIILVHLSNENSDADRMTAEIEHATGVTTVCAESGQSILLSDEF